MMRAVISGVLMKNLLVLLFIVVMSPLVSAGHVTQSGLKITKVMAGYEGGEIYFFVDGIPKNPKGCASPNTGYNMLVVNPAKSDVPQVLSILLMAKAADSSIEVQIHDDQCFLNNAVIKRVAIY